MTPAENVSRNISRLRRQAGWTQKEACTRLAAITGSRWSDVTWSQAEQVGGSCRQRAWNAGELSAMAALFRVTVGELLADGGECCTQCEGRPPAGFTCNTCGAGSEAIQGAELTVYRASHHSIVMGLYTTAAAARAHCEADMRCEWPNSLLDWIEDEEDGVAELVAESADGETATGYVVTSLEVASVYDEEDDE